MAEPNIENATKEENPRTRRPRIVLGVTGSVAAVKSPQIAALLSDFAEVKIVLTSCGTHFWRQAPVYRGGEGWRAFQEVEAMSQTAQREQNELQAPTKKCPRDLSSLVFTDADEWAVWQQMGDPVTHIQLRGWADVLVVAPLSAHSLAKLAGGLCDNLLTCVFRAWDFTEAQEDQQSTAVDKDCRGSGAAVGCNNNECSEARPTKRQRPQQRRKFRVRKPVVVCPAMNTAMWDHPLTDQHLEVLRDWGVTVVEPVSKTLACGDTGKGALADPSLICSVVKDLCAKICILQN